MLFAVSKHLDRNCASMNLKRLNNWDINQSKLLALDSFLLCATDLFCRYQFEVKGIVPPQNYKALMSPYSSIPVSKSPRDPLPIREDTIYTHRGVVELVYPLLGACECFQLSQQKWRFRPTKRYKLVLSVVLHALKQVPIYFSYLIFSWFWFWVNRQSLNLLFLGSLFWLNR